MRRGQRHVLQRHRRLLSADWPGSRGAALIPAAPDLMKLNALANIAAVARRQQRIDHGVAREQAQALLARLHKRHKLHHVSSCLLCPQYAGLAQGGQQTP